MSINKIPVKAFTAGDLATDVFTATAGQTDFTISLSATDNSVIVYVNDIAQAPTTDYSVNGTTLTFTSGLTVGDEVIVRIIARPSVLNTVEDGVVSTAKLATLSGLTAGSYGSASQVPVLSVNNKGQITAISSTAVAGVSSVDFDTITGVLTINTSNGGSYTPDLGIGTSDSPTFAGLTVTGNLTVSGTTTTVNATNLAISDPLIYMATGNTGNLNDIGIVGHFTSDIYQHTGFVRDATDGVWKLFSGVTTEPTTEIDFTTPTYDPLKIGALTTVGSILPSANASYDLGSTSFAWRNIYTNDLHLSNMNHENGNDIDGTRGTWTIQEGEEELYLINNRNKKKYKFTLQEIV